MESHHCWWISRHKRNAVSSSEISSISWLPYNCWWWWPGFKLLKFTCSIRSFFFFFVTFVLMVSSCSLFSVLMALIYLDLIHSVRISLHTKRSFWQSQTYPTIEFVLFTYYFFVLRDYADLLTKLRWFPLQRTVAWFQIGLKKNYRSTRCIVEAASALIRNNRNRCQFENAQTENVSGDKVMTEYSLAACCQFFYLPFSILNF